MDSSLRITAIVHTEGEDRDTFTGKPNHNRENQVTGNTY